MNPLINWDTILVKKPQSGTKEVGSWKRKKGKSVRREKEESIDIIEENPLLKQPTGISSMAPGFQFAQTNCFCIYLPANPILSSYISLFFILSSQFSHFSSLFSFTQTILYSLINLHQFLCGLSVLLLLRNNNNHNNNNTPSSWMNLHWLCSNWMGIERTLTDTKKKGKEFFDLPEDTNTKSKSRKNRRRQKKTTPVQTLYDTCKQVFASGRTGIVPPPQDIDKLRDVIGLSSLSLIDWFIDYLLDPPVEWLHVSLIELLKIEICLSSEINHLVLVVMGLCIEWMNEWILGRINLDSWFVVSEVNYYIYSFNFTFWFAPFSDIV